MTDRVLSDRCPILLVRAEGFIVLMDMAQMTFTLSFVYCHLSDSPGTVPNIKKEIVNL